MKHKFLSMAIIAVLAVSVWGVVPVKAAPTATTYYSQGSVTPTILTNWNTLRGGGGASPSNFTSGDVFVVQNGHNMATSAAWNVSGAGATIQIENGGTLTANHLVVVPVFQIGNGGTYIHNVTSGNQNGLATDIPGSTLRTFGATSTVEFQMWGQTSGTNLVSLPSSISWGNLTINLVQAMSGSWQQAGGLSTVNGNLTIKATGGATRDFRLSGNTAYVLTIGADLVISGGQLDLTNGNSSGSTITVNLGGNFNQTGGVFKSSSTGQLPTVVFTGGSSSAVTLSRSAGTFTNNSINWQIAAGKTVALNTNFGAGGWVAAGRTMTIDGAFQINQDSWPGNSGTWTYGAAGTLIFNNTTGTYGPIDATHVYWPATNGPVNVTVAGAGGITMNVARTIAGTFQTAATVTNGGNLTLSGVAQVNAGGWFASTPVYGSSSTLVYNSGLYGVSNEWPGSNGPHNVTIQNNTAVTWPSGSRSVPGNFTLTSGSLTLGNNIGDDLSVGGNWTNNGTFNANNRAVTFNGSAAQTIGGSAVTSFDYVTINNSNGVSLLQNEVVNSTLTLSNGRLTLGSSNLTMGSSAAAVAGTFSASNMIVADGTGMLCKQYGGTGTYDFPSGDATDTVEYSPVTLNFTSGSFSSGQACVRVTDDKRANMPGTNYLTRFWTLTASGITGFSANVTFNYLDADVVGTEANLSAALWNGTTWNVLDAADTANNRLTGTVTGFGDFSAGESGPLAVNLASFTATRSDDHNLIAWETASELHNLGFNLWRGTSASAPDMKLNEHVIPSQAPGGTEGVAYSYDDFGITSGVTYYYWLEDVDLNGTVTRHGPVSTSGETPTAIMVKDFTASPVATSPLTAFGVISAIGLAGLWLRHRK